MRGISIGKYISALTFIMMFKTKIKKNLFYFYFLKSLYIQNDFRYLYVNENSIGVCHHVHSGYCYLAGSIRYRL